MELKDINLEELEKSLDKNVVIICIHQTKEEVLEFVKRMHKRYKNVLFIFDRATWHKNNLVVGYKTANTTHNTIKELPSI